MNRIEVSRATIGRIPIYLKFLRETNHLNENISATAIAKQLGLGEVQVRKDLGVLCGAGRPKTGYKINELTKSLESFLGDERENKVVLVGAGKIGRALYDYSGFAPYGLDIVAAFDSNVSGEEKSKGGKPIYSMERFDSFCRENNIEIGIIAVPAESAQQVCDLMTASGIRGIWCFAPCRLKTEKHITVQYENMALSLAYLANSIKYDG